MPIDFNDGDGIQALDQNEHSDRWQYSVKSGVDVSPGTNDLTVQCSSGEVIFDGTNVSVAAQDNVALDPADDTQPRKDVVYVDANGALKVATGTPEAAVPSGETRFQTQRPAPNDLSGTDAVVVAEVWVAAGVSDIAAADVRDRRQFADLAARSVSTDDLDIGGSDFAASGDFLALATYDMGAVRTFSTSSSGYDGSDDFGRWNLVWDDLFPADATTAVSGVIVALPGTDVTQEVRLQNVSDGETIFEETGITSTSVIEFSPTQYRPTTDSGRILVQWETKVETGSNSAEIRDAFAAAGVQF